MIPLANLSNEDDGESRLVILLRHGKAERDDRKGDAKRELTSDGEKEVDQVGKGLRRLISQIDTIYTSPLIRCRQTAERLKKTYDGDPKVKAVDELKPESTTHDFLKFFHATDDRHLVIVGHEPNLSDSMMALIKVVGSFELNKAGAYVIRFEGDTARLEWLLSPKLFRKLR